MAIYVISDTHFGHANIIKYANRPFSDVEEMNKTIMDNWNSVINDNDEIYHLGDVCFTNDYSFLKKLKGKKKLILGNHDSKNKLSEYFEILQPIHELRNLGHKFVLSHYPIFDWNNKMKGSIHLYGHIHNSIMEYNEKNSFNVCVENIGYCPIKLERIVEFVLTSK